MQLLECLGHVHRGAAAESTDASGRLMLFVGRTEELAQLGGELARAAAAQPRVVLAEGEAGFGKSTLLAKFASGLDGLRVMRASADESELLLPYGVLAQLAGGDGWWGDAGRPPQGALAAGATFVRVLGAAQGEDDRPLVVVVDDLHWADQDSAAALLFAFRRLRAGADRVMVVMSARPSEFGRLGEGWARFIGGDDRATRLPLYGFGREEVAALGVAVGTGELSPGAVSSVLEHTAGNPLYCRALLEELSAEDLRRGDSGIRAPRALASLIVSRLSGLSADARDLVLATSVLGMRAPLATACVLAELSDPAQAVEEAISSGLLAERKAGVGRELAFSHPLVHGAVYDDLSPTRRRDLHERAAQLLGGSEALDHRVAAAMGPDPELAEALVKAAREAPAQGPSPQAASWLRSAAALSSAPADRQRFLLDAFEQLMLLGDAGGAAELAPEVERLGRSARASGLLGQLALLRGDVAGTEALLEDAWNEHDRNTEPLVGAAAAAYFSFHRLVAGHAADGLSWADRAVAAAHGHDVELEQFGLVMGAAGLALLGRGRAGAERLAVLPAEASDFPLEATDALVMRGLVNMYNENLGAARRDLQLAVARQRAGLPLRFSSQSLAHLGETEFRLGAWDDAVVHTELAVSLSHDADRVWDFPFVHGLATLVPANRGEWDVAERHAQVARAVAAESGLALHAAIAGLAASTLAAARSDPAGVLLAASAVRAAGELDSAGRPGAYDWRPLEVDALIATGRLDAARIALDEFEAAIPVGGLRSADVAVSRLRGTLAAAVGDQRAAAEWFGRAGATSEGLEKPFDLAVLALADGRRLRQAGDRRSAVPRLREARDGFGRLRAAPHVEVCDRELEQCGMAARGDSPGGGFGLTPAELAVARLVATGKSNREAADELYVTVKTVEFHLRGVFAKLGINSRREIAARLSGVAEAV